MKHFKLTFIVLGLFLLSCNQTNDKNKQKTDLALEEETIDEAQLEKNRIDSIKKFISLFQELDIEKISCKISYPLRRENPIPAIKNKAEFKQRFHEVFDKTLIDKIAKSSIDQWSLMGWRGTMLDQGDIWMGNSDGVITAINYQSAQEKKMRAELIEKEKRNLHISLRKYKNPVYKIKTKDYIIRIDELSDQSYRYASWKAGVETSSKPDIILYNGELENQGSGGSHEFKFSIISYTYKIFRNAFASDDSACITLTVERFGEALYSQDGTLEK